MDSLGNSRRNRIDLVVKSEQFTQFVSDIKNTYLESRKEQGIRGLSESEAESYFRHFEIVLADLASAWSADPELYIGYSRSKKYFVEGGSYWDYENGSPFISERIFLRVIDFLEHQQLIENHVAKQGFSDISSRMRAAPGLQILFDEFEVNWACILTDPNAPVIFVKDTENKNFISFPEPGKFDFEASRKNIRRINENLQSSLINLSISDDDFELIRRRLSRVGEQGIVETTDNDEFREPLEFSNRSLRRIFSLGSFSNGGRFYGGWWQGLPSEYRKFIEIEGSVTREMDYATLQPHMLYAFVDREPPEDSYILEGWDVSLRPLIKKAFNQLVNSNPSSRNPKQWHRFGPDLDPDPLPVDWGEMSLSQKIKSRRREFEKLTGRSYSDLLSDLIKFHEPIENDFFSSAWGATQNLDSQIAERVMIKLLDNSPPITALPIHDSFIVRRGGEKVLHNAMIESFSEVIGTKCKIDLDEAVYDPPEGYDGPSLVNMSDIKTETKSYMETHRTYHIRDEQWRKVHGLYGYD